MADEGEEFAPKAARGSEASFDVFISYRVNPDEDLADALKALLENAISPTPHVFVSGRGGLRPSPLGFKSQIQLAAQSAKVFIAVITEHSKEREWLFFEAGSAWGRGQVYTPLLIGTTPQDLPSSIADYQAIKASDRNQVELLCATVADAVG